MNRNLKNTDRWYLNKTDIYYYKGYCYKRNDRVYAFINPCYRISLKLAWHSDNKNVALMYLKNYIKQAENPQESIEITTIKDLHGRYLKNVGNKLKKSSIDNLRSATKMLASDSWIIDETLKDKLTAKLNLSKVKNSTKRLYLAVLHRLFNYAISENVIKENPINSFMFPKAVKLPIKPMELTHFNSIINYLRTVKDKHNLKDLLIFIRWTGCRINEAINIKWSDIGTTKITIHGKGDRIRNLPLEIMPELIKLLSRMRQESKTDRLFPKSKMTYEQNLLFHLQKSGLYKKAMMFHSIRKLRENEMLRLYKNSQQAVADFIGHTVSTQEKHYRKIFEAEQILESFKNKLN